MVLWIANYMKLLVERCKTKPFNATHMTGLKQESYCFNFFPKAAAAALWEAWRQRSGGSGSGISGIFAVAGSLAIAVAAWRQQLGDSAATAVVVKARRQRW